MGTLGEGKKFVWKKFACHFFVYFSSAEAGTQTFSGGFQEAGAPGLRRKEKVCVKKVCVLFRLPSYKHWFSSCTKRANLQGACFSHIGRRLLGMGLA